MIDTLETHPTYPVGMYFLTLYLSRGGFKTSTKYTDNPGAVFNVMWSLFSPTCSPWMLKALTWKKGIMNDS